MARSVVVVGGGVMGAATAYALALAGAKVTLVEQFDVAHDRGSSHGRSRIFRLAYPEAAYVRLAQQALVRWRAFEEDCGEQLLTTTGGVDHGDERVVAAIETALLPERINRTRLSAAEATERFTGMRFASFVLYQPDAGRLDADTVVRALWRRCAELGVDARFGERVVSVAEASSYVEVATDRDVIRADVAVLAAGAWLPKLVSELGIGLPRMTVTQEQPAYFAVEDGKSWPTFVHHADPVRYGLWTPGLGVKVGEHGTGPVVDPGERPPIDAVRLQRLTDYVGEWLPSASNAPVRVDGCLYTTTPDENFVLRRVGRVVVCSACSGHGFKFAPAIGERAAALALADA